jgi:SulP family sulfate permease
VGFASEKPINDIWAGLAAMLVALPSSIAFGVATYSVLGGSYAPQGALAGMLGAALLGLISAAFGGAPRLISAPCGPAAAVLSAMALESAKLGLAPAQIVLLLALATLLAGIGQILFGLLGLGRLIKYMPYPVVSGYLSGVGLIIMASQIRPLLGLAQASSWADVFGSPGLWQGSALAVGSVTLLTLLLAPRLTRTIPAVIVALVAGLLCHGVLALFDPTLLRLSGNPLILGSVAHDAASPAPTLLNGWPVWRNMAPDALWQHGHRALLAGMMLAVLLSIDTLKTCLVLDNLSPTRHDSDRTLIGQGLGNLASALCGGMAGAGTMGATMVNLASGGKSRWSGQIEGALALLAWLVLAPLLAYLPLAALAGILLVVGGRMIDKDSLRLLGSRHTRLDFAVIATVIVVALGIGLVAASASGVVMAIALFLRKQVGSKLVVRQGDGSSMFSRRVRSPAEMALLTEQGDQSAIFELQGSLFFGSSERLYRTLEPELARRRYILLDCRRVLSIDITAAHLLQQIDSRLRERGALLLLSHLAPDTPRGHDLRRYFRVAGEAAKPHAAPLPEISVFNEADEALEWIEDHLIDAAQLPPQAETALELREMDLFANRKSETLAELEACMQIRSWQAGQTIFSCGDVSDELCLIRRGKVRLLLPRDARHPLRQHHLATFGRGGFFGEMAFLEHAPRSADAVALTDCELYLLSRQRFDALQEHHKRLGLNLMEAIARLLAERLRQADAELNALDGD